MFPRAADFVSTNNNNSKNNKKTKFQGFLCFLFSKKKLQKIKHPIQVRTHGAETQVGSPPIGIIMVIPMQRLDVFGLFACRWVPTKKTSLPMFFLLVLVGWFF